MHNTTSRRSGSRGTVRKYNGIVEKRKQIDRLIDGWMDRHAE